MQNTSKYAYKPLSSPSTIRILKLFPGDRDSPLWGQLSELDLEDGDAVKSHPYEALSWCWGGQHVSLPLLLHGENQSYQINVSPNLSAALKGLRYEKEQYRRLWVDSISINQENADERNHQVAKMSEIYSKCSKACIWLDNSQSGSVQTSGDSEIAFDFIENKLLKLWEFDEVCKSTKNSKDWVSLMNLMTRPWFSRRWVIQEIALAPSATIHCGRRTMEWQDFSDAVSLLLQAESATHRLSEIVKNDMNIKHLQGLFEDVHSLGATLLVQAVGNSFRRTHGSVPRPVSTIEYLVSRLSVFEATEPRDTIYALLTISKDTAPQSDMRFGGPKEDDIKQKLPPKLKNMLARLGSNLAARPYSVDYKKPVIDVYQEFVKFCIDQSGSLDILCRPWAPRPDINQQPLFLPATGEVKSRNFTDQARPKLPSWIADKANTAFHMPVQNYTGDFHPMELGMDRRNADPLVSMPLPDKATYSASGTVSIKKNSLEFRKRTDNEYDQSMYVEGFILDHVACIKEPALLGNIPREWLELVDWEPRWDSRWDSRDMVPDELWKTLVADRDSNGLNPPAFYPRACTYLLRNIKLRDGLDTSKWINDGQCTIVAHFLRRVREVIYNRRMIRTAGVDDTAGANGTAGVNSTAGVGRGRLGLVPKEAHVNDPICILYGCSVPVVLRRHEKSKSQIKEDKKANYERFKARYIKACELLTRRYFIRKAFRETLRELKDTKQARRSRTDIEADLSALKIFTPLSMSNTQSWGVESVMDPKPAPDDEEGLSKPVDGEGSEHRNGNALQRNTAALMARKTDHVNGTASRSRETTDFDAKFRDMLRTYPEKPVVVPETKSYWYELIGEAYVHEMMNGEAIDYQNDHGAKSEIFELR